MLQNSCGDNGKLDPEPAFQRLGTQLAFRVNLHNPRVRDEGAHVFRTYRMARRASLTRRSH